MKHLQGSKKFIAALTGVVLLGAGCTQALPSSSTITNDTIERVQSTTPGLGTPDVSFHGGMRDTEWEMREKAMRIINETQGRTIDVEQIVGRVVNDPNVPNIFYFATEASDKAQTEVFNGIYKFDSATLNWERLFKHTSAYDDPRAVYVVAGIENASLIIKKMPYGGDYMCISFLDECIGEPHSLVRMPLDAPYNKLAPVDLTQEMQSAMEEQVRACGGRP